ncbi:putative disease resistance protein RGA1 isoform X2 [Carex rostrata]
MALSTIARLAGTIAEWAGSAVIGELISAGFSYLGNRKLPANGVAELKRIETALPQIKDAMSIAEALKMKDPSFCQWVEKFRLAVEASEDMLDDLEYKKLEDMVKGRDEEGGSASSSKKRKTCTINDDTLERLKEAVTMLDEAAKGVGNVLQAANQFGIQNLSESQQEARKVFSRETTSFLVERELFGREFEKHKIIDWLKRPTDARLSSFGIVGVGGLGKTTIVQYAYQEMRRSNHFDKTIWVCVSTNFSVEDITRKILGELGENNCSNKPLNALQETLKENIHSKKILLVLDDIWNDEKRSDWDQMFAPLRSVNEGSKIIFTTRMKSVADLLASVISTEHESLSLQGLREQELRLLFQSYAFHGFNLDNHRDLQGIGDQILKMLRGSPLAAKVIGCLLNTSMDHQYWRRVLNQGSLFNLEKAKVVVEVLKLSYYHLPANLQVCFRFCSIFPQDHQFDKDDLIKMWICSGFVQQQSSQEERLEDIGEDYFNLLLRKSFFEYGELRKGERRYVMHDLVHELAQNISFGECCRIEPNDKSITIPSTVRHVYVHECEMERVSHLENLRSLVVTTYHWNTYSFVLPKSLIKKSLRLLKICGSGYGNRDGEMPKEIRCLVHLRYLFVEGPHYVTDEMFKYLLLDSLYKLYHLQVLVLEIPGYYSYNSAIETTGMTNLLKLRYMRLPKEIMQTIHGVHKLTFLQQLTFFVGQESGQRINELGTLKNLQHLFIENIENIGDHTEAKGANLLGKNNLMSLSLKWTLVSNTIHPEKIIDNLQPPSSLMELTINNYSGERSPKWMEDSLPLNLSSLKLHNCPFWKNQLFSGNIPYLKILDIRDCRNLDKLPNMPLSLTEFRIRHVGLTSLPAMYQNSGNNTPAPSSAKSSLRVVKIEWCPNLKSLHGFLQQDNLDLQAIEELTINFCKRLVHLPTHGFRKLTSLKYLELTNNPKLVAMDFQGHLLPTKLQRLYMGKCGELDLPILEASYGITTLTELKLQKANIISIAAVQNSFSALKSLDIVICPALKSLGAFGKFVSLQKLKISDCPMLLADNNQSTLLPMALKYLLIENCGKLDEPLLESASSLPALTDLLIFNCANISCIPSSEKAFGSLNYLHISGCKKLVEHSSREQAHGADRGSSLASLKIKDLSIDDLSLLLIEPLRSLSFVSILTVFKCSWMEGLLEQWLLQNNSTLKGLTLNNVSNLNTLPATMVRLTVLENLIIYGAHLLEELPELPASLRLLYITGASSLRSLPATMARLTALERLEISGADLLEELPELPASLWDLNIDGASSLKSLPATIARLTALENLRISRANLLEEVPELPASLKIREIVGRGGRVL